MNYATNLEEIAVALDRVKKIKERSDAFNRPVCSRCEFYDFNEMSDEAYCVAKDYEPIRIYRKHRPEWCPRLNKQKDYLIGV